MAKLWTAPVTSETLSNFNGKIVFLIHCPQWMQDKSFWVLQCKVCQPNPLSLYIYICYHCMLILMKVPGLIRIRFSLMIDTQFSTDRHSRKCTRNHGLDFLPSSSETHPKKLEGFLESFPCKYYLGQNKNVSFLWMPVKTNLSCRVSCVFFLELLSNFGAK